jgi:hypothetical protein
VNDLSQYLAVGFSTCGEFLDRPVGDAHTGAEPVFFGSSDNHDPVCCERIEILAGVLSKHGCRPEFEARWRLAGWARLELSAE